MRRILLMCFTLFLKTPYYWLRIWICSKKKHPDYAENFKFVKYVTIRANKAGRVTIASHGLENLPGEDGFVFFPNHQGLFDVLVFLESCPRPFAFVIKEEASNVILLKQVVGALGSLVIERDNLKQSLEVIRRMAEEVKKGRNFLIFAEGTRSRKGNELLEFKGGSFKSAVKARCPIVPCALIDSYKPFDENDTNPLTVHLYYLPPIYYEEYKDMKTVDIAAEVKKRIGEVIKNHMANV